MAATSTLRRRGIVTTGVIAASLSVIPASSAADGNVNADATNVTLTTPDTAATVNTCSPFTAIVIPSPGAGESYTVTVRLTQQAAEAPGSTSIGFCDVSKFSNAGPNPQANPETATGSADSGGFPAGGGDGTASNGKTMCGSASSLPAPSSPTVITCTATYTTDSNGQVSFGVTSDTPGSMNVLAYVDKNGDSAFVAGTDPYATSHKTWAADDAGAIDCNPESSAHSVGGIARFVCSVTTTGGTPGAGSTHVKFTIVSGPDQGNTSECTYDSNAASRGRYGNYNCAYANNGQTGSDTINGWADTTNNDQIDGGEYTDQITVYWGPAGTGAPTISVTQPSKTAGQNVTLSGSSGSYPEVVTLSYKNVTTDGSFKTLATVQGQDGKWSYVTPVSYNTTYRASNSDGSASVPVTVNVKVTISSIRYLGRDSRGKCITRFLGGTYPYVPGAPVWIRNAAVSPSQPIGSGRVSQFGGSGRYDIRFGLNCGQVYKLYALISGTSSTGVKYAENGVSPVITYRAGY